ncbi:MAG: nucleotidyltransferase domain-containing protein [Nanoarchaeota archaeon]|nr:nucleotidyltransferase domain-containing protein [Nanoarchaeota archaeon]MBU4352311.1 nucleotidyltransferase domain-containing protein [Nanoarchaeota archaeon]MBU4456052.1 nucleotidyltransferase domain-containing protein [Nanoarchaeota archaeon]MCG2719855.1 nucleotidyltransferase domain-containing protein [Nanoarchaeota archaeon]
MNKLDVKKQLRLAIENIHKEYSNLKGIFLYGSFVRDYPNPQDIDILPVLEKKESERENPWLRGNELIRDYFKKYFPDFSQAKPIAKSGLNGGTDYYWTQNILHAGRGVVYLTGSEHLRQSVEQIRSGLEYFIGTEEATLKVKAILSLC